MSYLRLWANWWHIFYTYTTWKTETSLDRQLITKEKKGFELCTYLFLAAQLVSRRSRGVAETRSRHWAFAKISLFKPPLSIASHCCTIMHCTSNYCKALVSIGFCSQIRVLEGRCVTDVRLWFRPQNCVHYLILPRHHLSHGCFVTCLAPCWLPSSISTPPLCMEVLLPCAWKYFSPVQGSTPPLCMEVPLMCPSKCASAVCASNIFCRWKRPQADFHPLSFSLWLEGGQVPAEERRRQKNDRRAKLQSKVVWRRRRTCGINKLASSKLRLSETMPTHSLTRSWGWSVELLA